MSSSYAIYRELVMQLMQGEEVLPSLPNLTFQIRRAIQAPNTTSRELESLISRDPALSALLVKHASSAFYRQARPVQSLRDVIALLGLRQLSNITMAHSVKSLFTQCAPMTKKLFLQAWEDLLLKACTSAVLAHEVGTVAPEHALLAGLLSEVGSLVLLSAFRGTETPPTLEEYQELCRNYSRSLGILLLKKWAVDEEYVQIIRYAGHWQGSLHDEVDCLDLVNLTLFHSMADQLSRYDCPELADLAAFQKLPEELQALDEQGRLRIITENRLQIQQMARSMMGTAG